MTDPNQNAFKKFSRANLAHITNSPYNLTAANAGGQFKRLSPTDELLLSKGGTSPRALQVYFDLLQSPLIYGAFDKQVAEIVSRRLVVEPASDRPIDVKAAEFIEEQLANMGLTASDSYLDRGVVEQDIDVDMLTRTLAVAYITGSSTCEIVWGRNSAGQVIADKIIPVDSCRILFAANDTGKVLPKLLTRKSSLEGIFLPPRKFIMHRFYAVPTQDPYGAGIGKQLYWANVWKEEAISSWLQLMDKHVDPALVGIHPESATTDEQDCFFNLLKGFGQDAALMMPEGFGVEKLDAGITGSAGLLGDFVKYCDEQVLLAILGESTTGMSGVGSQARETVHNSLRVQKARMLSNSITNCLRQTLVAWLTALNFPDATAPKVHRDFSDASGEIEQLSALAQLGVKMDLRKVGEKYGVPLPELSS